MEEAVETRNPLHGHVEQVSSQQLLPPASAVGPLHSMSPPLHYFVLLVLGPYHRASKDPPPLLTPHFFAWSAIFFTSFGMMGPYLGPDGGGWLINMVCATLFLGALLWFVLLRRTLALVLYDLDPVIRCFSTEEHNPMAKIVRDRVRMAAAVVSMGLGFPAIAVAAAVYWFGTVSFDFSKESENRIYVAVLVAFVGFFFACLILAVQLMLLFAVAQLYIFRLRYLFSALLLNDQEMFKRELNALTPRKERMLLAEAPTTKPRAAAAVCSVLSLAFATPMTSVTTPYTLRPYDPGSALQAQGGGGLNDSDTPSQLDETLQVDTFLRVYRSIKEEAVVHAQSWSVPILLFVLAYSFVFLVSVVSIIRGMVQNGIRQGEPIRLEVLYVFLALGYIILNLVPIISINSTWPRLLAKPEANFSRWRPQQRLILSAYFTEHPFVFPVLGVALGWNNVLCVGQRLRSKLPVCAFSH